MCSSLLKGETIIKVKNIKAEKPNEFGWFFKNF